MAELQEDTVSFEKRVLMHMLSKSSYPEGRVEAPHIGPSDISRVLETPGSEGRVEALPYNLSPVPETPSSEGTSWTPRDGGDFEVEDSEQSLLPPTSPLYNISKIPAGNLKESEKFTIDDIIFSASQEMNAKIAELADIVADLPTRLLLSEKSVGEKSVTLQPHSNFSSLAVPQATKSFHGKSSENLARLKMTSVGEMGPPSKSGSKNDAGGTQQYSSNATSSSTMRARGTSILRRRTTPLVSSMVSRIFGKRDIDEVKVPFERAFAALIAFNAIFMGVSLQYRSQVGEHLSLTPVVNATFTIIFVFEILYRVLRQRMRFFVGRLWRWNTFDFIVVFCMAIDEVLRRIVDPLPWNNPSSLLSTLRMFRLVRVLKTMKVLSYLNVPRHMRLLLLSIKETVGLFLCIAVVLLSAVYIVALIITNGALDHCAIADHQEDQLCLYFGTLWRSCSSASKALLGGVRWGTLVDVLAGSHAFYAVVFMVFIVFCASSIMQVATGMFVWLVHDVSEAEKKQWFINDHLDERRRFIERMETLFKEVDVNQNGELTKNEMKLALTNDKISSEFVSMDLDSTAIESIFDLLDVNQNGFVSIAEFSLGCMRLQGKARAVDMEKVRNEIHAMHLSLEDLVASVRTSVRTSRVSRVFTSKSSAPLDNYRKQRLREYSAHSSPPIRRMSKQTVCTNNNANCIEKPELRAMLVEELEFVASTIRKQCSIDAWTDQFDKPLELSKVNLYDFTFHYIAPRTSTGSITLVGLAFREYKTGQILTQVLEKDGRLCAKAQIVEDIVGCDVTVELLKGQFAVDDGIVQSSKVLLDGRIQCGNPSQIQLVNSISYKELVSPVPTAPHWFVCHWWGEPILDFVQCCKEHATKRKDDAYWVCAYANRQHDLGADIGEDPENSSFRRAMIHAQGLLLVLDPSAIPFHRIWCCFELFTTITSDKTLDVITMAQTPKLLTQKPIGEESAIRKFLREKDFPINVLTKGIHVKLENGNASVQADKTRILNSMGKNPNTGEFSNQLQQSMIDFANRGLRGYIAIAAWPQAIKRGRVLNFNHKSSEVVSLPEVLRCDTERSTLEMSFSGMQEVTDGEVASISHGLPPNILLLQLSFENCFSITDAALESLADGIESLRLQKLALDFAGCRLLTDKSISYLSMKLPTTLTDLSLQFALIPDIGKAGAKALADNLPSKVSQLQASFRGSKFDHHFQTVRQLKRMTR